jgi:hypothetical protein
MSTVHATPLLSRREKAVLTAQVLREYVPALRTVRRNDLPAMVRAARDVPPTSSAGPGDPYWVARRLSEATMRILRLLPSDSRCLVRSVVVLRLMARRSLQATLVIGVHPGADFEAHAWVEHCGRPVLPVGDYQRLTEF